MIARYLFWFETEYITTFKYIPLLKELTQFQTLRWLHATIHLTTDYNMRRVANHLLTANVMPVCQLALEMPQGGTSLSIAAWGSQADGTYPAYPSWGNVTVKPTPPWYTSPGKFLIDTSEGTSTCPVSRPN